MRVAVFYSQPYTAGGKRGSVGVTTLVSNDKFVNEENIDDIIQDLEIEVADRVDVHYSMRRNSSHESGSKTVELKTEGYLFDFENVMTQLWVYIKDKKTGQEMKITVKPEFTKKTYGYFSKVPHEYR